MAGAEGGSLPLRGAWIEMLRAVSSSVSLACRSPYGERGLKFLDYVQLVEPESRSPYGERGLKLMVNTPTLITSGSLPLRGAWIEIVLNAERAFRQSVAPLTGSVD